MKYCTHCGKEILDEAVVCSGCGCSINADGINNSSEQLDEAKIQKYKIKNKKTVIMAIAAICVAVALVFASIVVFNSIRANKIMEELSGERFEYNGDTSYSINRERYTFDEDGNCEDYSYFYGITMDDPMEFTFNWTYKIEFKKKAAYVVFSNDDELKIKYDEEGEIIALYDSEEKTTYERK